MSGLWQPGVEDVAKGLRQGIQRPLVLEHRVILRLHFNPAVGFRQIVELADLDPCDVIETALAVEIAADAVSDFAFLTRNLAQMRVELLPEFGNALNGLLGKCSAQSCNQQEVPVFEAWLRQFDAC
ncbi:hypothetical protein D3C84_1042310 [compost metagenome]